jgi:hypothetical protein
MVIFSGGIPYLKLIDFGESQFEHLLEGHCPGVSLLSSSPEALKG